MPREPVDENQQAKYLGISDGTGGGAYGTRTRNPLLAKQVRYQLRQGPQWVELRSDPPRYRGSDAVGGLGPGVLGGAASAGECPDDAGDREPDGHELLHDASDLESDSGPSWT